MQIMIVGYCRIGVKPGYDIAIFIRLDRMVYKHFTLLSKQVSGGK